jgi:tetratricopeptide (TPR) repeat protein
MTKPSDHKMDLPVAREVAYRSATPLVVYGNVSPLGTGYSLSMVIERIEGQPRTPVTTESKAFEARNKSSMFDAIHQAATWIRQTAGEAGKDISANDTQPEDATTSSWEALDFFAKGEQLFTPPHMGDAVTVYKQATHVDPGFALALARIAQGQGFLRQKPEAFEYWRKAVEALDQRHVTRREDFRIRGMHAIATEDYAAAEQSTRMFTILYPRDYMARHYHAEALRNLDRLEEAYAELLESRRLRPTGVGLNNLVSVGLQLGKQQDVAGYLKEMEPAATGYYGSLAKFLNRDYAGCDADLLAVIRGPDSRLRSAAYGARASLLAELGRAGEARAVLEQGIAADVAPANFAGRARKLLASAHLRLAEGDKGNAREFALEAARRDGDTACLWRASSLLARAGFAADARKVLARINSPDEGRRFDTARTIAGAEIALSEGRVQEALAGFSRADQLAPPIHPRDFLARAWELAGRHKEALGVWQRIADRPALVWESQLDLHPPGLWTEALVRVAGLSPHFGRLEAGRAALTLFLKVREGADPNSSESRSARRLLEQKYR